MTVVSVEHIGDLAWITIDSPPVNATSTAVRAGLLSAVHEVAGARLAVLRGAGRCFVAGGDMTEFDRVPELPHLPDVIDAIEASETPFLALLHGSVLGGGLEIAMACAWRLAAPGTQFGLPEVNVGLIPGAGGSQRAPRLVGWDAAIRMACEGRMIPAVEMLALGGIDGISDNLIAAARAHNEIRPTPVSARAAPDFAPDLFTDAETLISKRAKGRKSPLHNLTALQWAQLPYAEGQPKERALHLELRASAESQALRHAFFAERSVSQPAVIAGQKARDISRVAVVGGGLMGAGIATACLGAGLSVDVIERDEAAAEEAESRISELLGASLKKGRIDQATLDAQRAALATHSDANGGAAADLAIEAVFEDLTAKQAVFEDLSSVLRPDAILATNTSYLDPRDIFSGIVGPERCLGLHFFSPAHVMKLLEVIPLPTTDPAHLATAFRLGKRLRKVAVLAGICDGFIGNRMLAAYRRAAEYMLADGAMPEQIDAAMRDFGMAMGPFEVQDMAGLQIAEANRRRQDATRGPEERYIPIGDRLCAAGRFGQRTGKGWYLYKDDARQGAPDPVIAQMITDFSAEAGIARRKFSTEEIQTCLLAVLANEGARIVEEGIAETDAAVDMVKLHGYGFPRWRGGPLFAAEALGRETMRQALSALEADSPGSWQRAGRFK